MSKKQDDFKREVLEKKETVKEAISKWSTDQLKEHMAKVADIYKNRKAANKLGNFDFDHHNVYHWSTYDDNVDKLPRRLGVGWGFATREDAEKAGLTDSRFHESVVEGESCVEMSHKNVKAVLLKIPRELHDINREVKQRIRDNRPITDADGHSLDMSQEETGDKVVNQRREQMVQVR